MGFLKDLGSFVGQVAGGVIGGAVEVVGEVTDSQFIKDVGKGVYHATSRTGEIVGSLASGTYDAVGGLITDDKHQSSQGLNEIFNTVGDTASGIGKGIVNVTEKGIDTVSAILDGDKEKALELGKDLAKVAAVGVLSIGIIDIVDGLDGVDSMDTADAGGVDVENPNMHHVQAHWVNGYDRADGTHVDGYWRDGDGNTSVNTNQGWTQHNPDFKAKA
jgi:hypothetical protein